GVLQPIAKAAAIAAVPSVRRMSGSGPECGTAREQGSRLLMLQSASRRRNRIGQRSDGGYIDRDVVAGLKRELVRWNDAGAGEQHATGGEARLSIEKLHELAHVAPHLGERGL